MTCFWKYDFPVIIGVSVIAGLILLVFVVFIILKVVCSMRKMQTKKYEKKKAVEKVKVEKQEMKKKEFIKYKVNQHDVPIGKPYDKEMDPDFDGVESGEDAEQDEEE
jgi:predicted membrane protein